MKVFGLHLHGHNTGACLIDSGKIVCMTEARLTRKKHDECFPERSIRYCLEAFNTNFEEIDIIVIDTFNLGNNHSAVTREDHEKRMNLTYLNNLGLGWIDENKLRECPSHHLAHAASAFFATGFDDAAILVVDGGGYGLGDHYLFHNILERQTMYRGVYDHIYEIRSTSTPENMPALGHMYELATKFLGFGVFNDGKTMGLASYGAGEMFKDVKLLKSFSGGVDIISNMKLKGPYHYNEFIDKFNLNPNVSALPKKEYNEFAFRVQCEFEEGMLHLAKYLQIVTKSRNLCIAGGCGLNCLANSAIKSLKMFDSVFIQPAATDKGIALGHALYGWNDIAKQPRLFKNRFDPYLGKYYSDKEIKDCIDRNYRGLTLVQDRLDETIRLVVNLLIEKKVIGWFQGCGEVGPRALGNRSILADPRFNEVKDEINKKIKHREWWRPFAPVVLVEYANDWFDLDGDDSPYMLLAPLVKEDKRALVPAITHIDNTSRVQTVSRDFNPVLYELIAEFFKKTGVPMILNTSLNKGGDPIVETPQDAINCLMNSEMDYLAIGNYLIRRK